jgi:hypothetical protein
VVYTNRRKVASKNRKKVGEVRLQVERLENRGKIYSRVYGLSVAGSRRVQGSIQQSPVQWVPGCSFPADNG